MTARASRYRRTTDRIEDVAAWVLLAAGMMLVVVSCTVSLGMSGRTADRAPRVTSDRTPGVASLITSSPAASGDLAPRNRTAGRTAPLFIPTGSAPNSAKDALVDSLATVIVVLGFGAVVLIGLWVVVRRATLAYNCAQWEREWRAVAPIWSKGEDRRD